MITILEVNILTASMVKERHEIILGVSNSVFEEEERAFLLVTKLSWILPTIVLCGGLVDLLLSFVYMKFYHPWKEILSGRPLRWAKREAGLDKDRLDNISPRSKNSRRRSELP